jgi:hypothetical protein
MSSASFWDFFNSAAKPHLAARAETFAKIFTYLDRFDRPVGIIETGCVRQKDNWAGDGCSTILFDKYAETHPGSAVYSVDISEDATAVCRQLVSPRVRVHTGDSVTHLKSLAESPPADLPALDLLYLDSYDVDFDDTFPSAFHHIKELLAVFPLITSETLVVVDDSPPLFTGYVGNNGFHLLTKPGVGGKGKLIATYAEHLGIEPAFIGYQCGWTGLKNR